MKPGLVKINLQRYSNCPLSFFIDITDYIYIYIYVYNNYYYFLNEFSLSQTETEPI